MRRFLFLLFFAFAPVVGWPADRLVMVDTRPGVRVGYWLMERAGATATVVLLPGGAGGIGIKQKGGEPTSDNFLVRSREYFREAGFNVAVVGKPSDRDDLDLVFRTQTDHIEDLRRVVERLHRDLGKPVWLVGTSRGTTSAAAAGIALGASVDGIVLSSSITDASLPGAVQNMPLAEIRIPVLVLHHRRDACRSTPPAFAPRIVEGLTSSPSKKLVMVEGGGGAYGNPCEPMHWHGFIGMEREAVAMIADFIRNPAPEKP
jgi:pimeloyl-ACP methyl ester carboxylesterase